MFAPCLSLNPKSLSLLPILFALCISHASAQHIELLDSSGREVDKNESSFAERLMSEVLGGLIGYSGAIATGLTIGVLGTEYINCPDEDGDPCDIIFAGAGFMSAGATALFLVPGGVNFAGDLAGGNGSYWASFVGGLAGAGLGALGAGGLIHIEDDGPTAVAAYSVALAFPLIGSIVGYELSVSDSPNSHDPQTKLHERASGFSVSPTAAIAPDLSSITVGLSGTL